MGGHGTWYGKTKCQGDRVLVGYRFRGELSSNAADNVFGVNLEMMCKTPEKQDQNKEGMSRQDWGDWGEWTAMKMCPTGSAICGIQTFIYPLQGWWHDDAGLIDVKFTCCLF